MNICEFTLAIFPSQARRRAPASIYIKPVKAVHMQEILEVISIIKRNPQEADSCTGVLVASAHCMLFTLCIEAYWHHHGCDYTCFK